jgi:protein tyrosine/serine phosphatase
VNERLYRGGQPSEEGMRELRALGVKTVVNLRWLHSDRDEIGSLELGYEHIRMHAWHAKDEDVIRFLRIATDPTKQPVFLHCQHGSDRTGTMIAVYRMAVEGWTADEAIDEMMRGGHGFHSMYTNLTQYLRELDVERIRREAGISPSRSDRWADSEIR